jgi:hypothetical protein
MFIVRNRDGPIVRRKNRDPPRREIHLDESVALGGSDDPQREPAPY